MTYNQLLITFFSIRKQLQFVWQPLYKEDPMSRKKGKPPVSFDAMVKFFLQTYHIPSKKDVDDVMARLDRLELLIENLAAGQAGFGQRGYGKDGSGRVARRLTASDIVYETIKRLKEGASFGDIRDRTGFDDKKLRNIIYRLKKLDRITYKRRGIYMAVE